MTDDIVPTKPNSRIPPFRHTPEITDLLATAVGHMAAKHTDTGEACKLRVTAKKIQENGRER